MHTSITSFRLAGGNYFNTDEIISSALVDEDDGNLKFNSKLLIDFKHNTNQGLFKLNPWIQSKA